MDKSLLLAPANLPEEDVPISIGVVRVRGLTRGEAHKVSLVASDSESRERKMLAFGMVDPPLTENEAGQWLVSGLAGDINTVVMMIGGLSGMLDGDGKAQFKSFREELNAGVRVLPSAETDNDGGATPGGDVG